MDRRRFGIDGADGAMMLVISIWALSNVFSKTAISEISPFSFVFARLLLVLPVMFGLVALRRKLVMPAANDWPLLVLAGVCGYGLYNVLYIMGIERTSPFSVALLLSLGPVFTLLLAAILRIERITAAQWLGVAIAIIGVAIFLSDKLRGGHYHPIGDLITLAAALIFAVYSIASRPLTQRYGAPTATAWSVLVGFLVATPITWGDFRAQDWAAVGPAAWFGLLFAAYGSLLIAYNLWAWAIQRVGVGRTAPYLLLLPVMTGVLSAILVGERFGPVKIFGALLVLGGTAVVRIVSGGMARRAARASSPDLQRPAEAGTMSS